jgi:Fe2+ or Zn2+ uptake regulation protein
MLHTAGYKYTRPRRVVAEVLLASPTHLTAPDIVERVAAQDASVGRMSVYRTLDLFTRIGLIRPAFQGGASARYVMMVGGHHHHLVCQSCGAVLHFDDCPLAELTGYLERRFKFTVEGHLLEFFGLCERCAQAIPSEES